MLSVLIVSAMLAVPARAQTPPGSRAAEVAAAQAEKARNATPYRGRLIERLVQEIDEHLAARHVKWHPFYGHAYPGAGLTAGAGYMFHTRDYDTLDVRAAMSLNKSKRAEIAYVAPRLMQRRVALSVLGGWAEGLGQSFYGVGATGTSLDDRARFDFRRGYGSAQVTLRPWRGMLGVDGGVDVSRYEQRTGESSFTSRYGASTLPGFGATVTYVEPHARVGLDWRPAAGYAQRGGAVSVAARRVIDTDDRYTFNQVNYDVVQHVPVLRDAWVLSFHGRAETTYTADGNVVPFYLLPTLGNATTLRAFANQRFRDRNSLLLSAEWRVLVNRFADLGFFYDTGKVAARPADLDLRDLQHGYGVGLRLHTLETTPIRVELARGSEGFRVVFGAVAAF
jgi:hypothetical protein